MRLISQRKERDQATILAASRVNPEEITVATKPTIQTIISRVPTRTLKKSRMKTSGKIREMRVRVCSRIVTLVIPTLRPSIMTQDICLRIIIMDRSIQLGITISPWWDQPAIPVRSPCTRRPIQSPTGVQLRKHEKS